MHFQKGAHSNVCPNIVPKICLTHLAEIIDASVWLLTRKGSVNSSQHGHHQAQVAFIQKIRACIILRFLSISQMSACYQAQMARSSNYLLSRFVFDHLWGIPGDTEDHQVNSWGMNIILLVLTVVVVVPYLSDSLLHESMEPTDTNRDYVCLWELTNMLLLPGETSTRALL